MATPAGWFQDPYSRFAQRYWDGERWTEHVADTENKQQVDPLGASSVVPFFPQEPAVGKLGEGPTDGERPANDDDGTANARSFAAFNPPSHAPAGSTQPGPPTPNPSAGPTLALLERMRPDSVRRPRPSLPAALAGGAGAVAAGGVSALVVGDSGGRWLFAVAGLICIAAGIALRLGLKQATDTTAILRAAAVGLGVVGIAAVGIAIGDDPESLFLPFLVVAALYVAAWALPGFRGRTIMLGCGAFSLVTAVAQLAGQQQTGDDGARGVLDRFVDQGYVFLILGALLLGATWFLDHRGYRGTATGLVASGIVSAVVGTGLLAAEFGNDAGGLVLAALVGLLICYVGGHGARRATTWWGAAITVVAIVGLLGTAIEPSSASGSGGVAVLGAAVIIGGLLVVQAVRANQARPADLATSTWSPPGEVSGGSDADR